MKRILITGKNSYIGTSVENWLLKTPDQYHVDTLDVKDPSWKNYDFSSYDVVFHVAGIAHIKETKKNRPLYFQVNRDLAYEVAKKAKESGVKQFIFMSSMAVYGLHGSIDKKVIINNLTPTNPNNFYGMSKMEAEIQIKKICDRNFRVVILRPPIVYGVNSPGNYATLRKISLKFPIFPYIENERSMLNIENLCSFIENIINSNSSGVYFPQDKSYHCTSRVVERIALENGKKIYLSSKLGNFIRIFKSSKTVCKAFGNLTYSFDSDVNDNVIYDAEKYKYSVLMSVYHRENPIFFRESIESMLSQSIKPDELVIVKDGPLTKELDEVISEYESRTNTVIVSIDENVGLGKALNLGLNACNNSFVARMDSDDISENNRCELQLSELIKNDELSLIGSAVLEFNGNKDNILSRKNVVEKHEDILKIIKYKNPLNHPTVMFRRNDVLSVGSYEHFPFNEDYFLWIKMIEKNYRFGNINIPLVRMRVNDETYLRRGGWDYYLTQRRIFKYMLNKNLITHSQYFLNNSIRFIVRIILPNKFRRFFYLRIMRKSI